MTSTDIHIHDRGTADVKASGETIWLYLPLSTDGTARITVFLQADHAVVLAEKLLLLANRAVRIAAINAESAEAVQS